MLISLLKSKLHQARVTDANLEYPGSMGVSRELLAASGLLPYERVLVSNIANGQRFETYVIPVDEPGQIILNGAAAHCGKRGDRVIVMSFALLHTDEVAAHQPTVAVLDAQNHVIEIHH
jgi:aspartate 1-decarboxylase